MLSLLGPGFRTAHGMSRREMIRVGGLSMSGVALSDLLTRQASAESSASIPRTAGFGRAKRCIILYLSGGHPQHDMFDPKPDAPAEIRGEFGTIETSVPTLRFGEHCPLSAKLMNQMALIRSMNHTHNDHGRGSYWMFTGYMYPGSVPDVNSMSRQDMPHMGSCLAKLAPGSGPMFPFIIVPHRMDVAGGRRAGQFAGMLGPKFDPMLTGGNPNDDDFRLKHIPLVPNEDPGVIRRRLGLVDQLNQQVDYLRDGALSQSLKENRSRHWMSSVPMPCDGLLTCPLSTQPSASDTDAICSVSPSSSADVCCRREPDWCNATGSAPRERTGSPGTRTGTISRRSRRN